MESHLAFARAALVALVMLANVAATSAATPEAKGRTPSDLVDAALRTELDGPSPERESLLKQALSMDPDFARARWHLGFVRLDDAWLSLDEAARRAGGDKQLTNYRARRDALIDTADNHRELARWCHKNKLFDEERIHWAKVLEFEREDAEALAALGLRWSNGRLLTREQIDAEKKQVVKRAGALLHWRPKLTRWRTAIESGSPKQIDEALRQIGALNDPEAIPALLVVFAANGTSARSNQLNLLLIDSLARMPQNEATEALLGLAVYAESGDVALAAANALKKRPMHSYVPRLIATIPSKLKSQFHVTVMPGGSVVHQHEIQLQTQQGTYSLTYESFVQPTTAAIAGVVTPVALATERNKAAAIQANVAARTQMSESLEKRVRFVLKHTTGFDEVEDPHLWIKQYSEYYGWSVPEKSNQEFKQNAWEYQVYFPLPPPTVGGEQGSSARSADLPVPAASPVPQVSGSPAPLLRGTFATTINGECFAAGTPVMTIAGPRPIDSIKPGDRVLSRNVETGELAYKTVQNRTLRQSVQMMKIVTGSGSIAATPGHPFFVAGKGWRVAKHLQIGDRLCGLSDTATVDYLEDLPRDEVYNLIVSDFNTFFVGEQKLLVHDDMPLEDTTALVPGLVADAAR